MRALRHAGRFIGNVVFKTLLLMGFSWIGWVKIHPVVSGWGFWGTVITAACVAVVFTVLGMVMLGRVFEATVPGCLIVAFLMPVAGLLVIGALVVWGARFVEAPSRNSTLLLLLLIGTLLTVFTLPWTSRKAQEIVVTAPSQPPTE